MEDRVRTCGVLTAALLLELDGEPLMTGTVPDEDGGHCERWSRFYPTRLPAGRHTFTATGDLAATRRPDVTEGSFIVLEYRGGTLMIDTAPRYCR